MEQKRAISSQSSSQVRSSTPKPTQMQMRCSANSEVSCMLRDDVHVQGKDGEGEAKDWGRKRHSFLETVIYPDWNMEAKNSFQTGTTVALLEVSDENCPRIAAILKNKVFRITMTLMIILNAIQLGLSVDITGRGWTELWRACEHAFTTIFAIEMVMMISVLGRSYFQDNWLRLDFAVVIVSMLDAWIFPAIGNFGLPFRQFRLFRLLRIAKLTRVVPELTVVVEGLLNSMKSLFWIFVLLCVFLYAGAICCVEVIGHDDAGYPSFNDSQNVINDDLVEDFNNYVYYGSIYRSMFTLFGICLLSEWSLIRPVAELHSAMVPFFILLVCFVAFGVLNVIIGIVVDKTMEAMQEFKEEAIAKENEEKMDAAEHIAELMFDLDTDGDGRISNEEMQASFKNEKMVKYLRRLDLPYSFNSAEFIHMLDVDGNGSLSKKEFVGGLFRLVFCNDFQRSCLHQMAIGALHNSMHQVCFELKSDLQDAIKAISQEIRMDLAPLVGTWEPLEPKFNFNTNPRHILATEKLVGAVDRIETQTERTNSLKNIFDCAAPPEPDGFGLPSDTGTSFYAFPMGEAREIHTRKSLDYGMQSPPPSSGTTRPLEPQKRRFSAKDAPEHVVDNRWRPNSYLTARVEGVDYERKSATSCSI